MRHVPSMGVWDSRARNRRTDGATGVAKSHREKGRTLEELTFGQWLAQGGDYVVWLGAIAAGATGICALLYKGYRALTRPARDAAEKSEEGDRALHERVDGLECKHEEYDEKLANDFASINLLKREYSRQAESTAMLTEGVYLIIQHLVTNDHIQDMETWMREHAKATASPHLGERKEQ